MVAIMTVLIAVDCLCRRWPCIHVRLSEAHGGMTYHWILTHASW